MSRSRLILRVPKARVTSVPYSIIATLRQIQLYPVSGSRLNQETHLEDQNIEMESRKHRSM